MRTLVDSQFHGSVAEACKKLGIQRRRMYRYYTEGISAITWESRAGVAKIAESLKVANTEDLWRVRVSGPSDHDEFCPHCGQRMPRNKEVGLTPESPVPPVPFEHEPSQQPDTPAPNRIAAGSGGLTRYMSELKKRHPDAADISAGGQIEKLVPVEGGLDEAQNWQASDPLVPSSILAIPDIVM